MTSFNLENVDPKSRSFHQKEFFYGPTHRWSFVFVALLGGELAGPPGHVILRPSPMRVFTLALVGRRTHRVTPGGFSRITRVKRGRSPQKLLYPRNDQFDTYCEIKLWRHMSGHVRTKSADFAICRTRVCVLASQRMSMHSNFHASFLVFMEV